MSAIIRDENKKEGRIPSRGKVHSTENTKYRQYLMKMKQQEILMERNLISLIENMKLEPKILQPILHDMNNISRQRRLSMDGVKKTLKEITEELRSAKSIMDCPEQIKKLDVNAYKQRLERLSKKIQNFKESCQLQSLSQEQTALESELREFELNLHKYGKATDSINKPKSPASCNKENKSYDSKEIQNFHALIAKTAASPYFRI